MNAPGSVSHWIELLKYGDHAAAQPLWERYYERLVNLARQVLKNSRSGQADEHDIVQLAFLNFFQGVSAGRFPDLSDRDDLWRLLVVMTARKAMDQIRRERRQREALVTRQHDSAIYPVDGHTSVDLAQVVGQEPTPEFTAQVVEQYRELFDRLDDEKLRQIAVWKLECFNNSEIAKKLGCSRRTVIRKLETIRLIWNGETER